jgi:hypothetical protein
MEKEKGTLQQILWNPDQERILWNKLKTLEKNKQKNWTNKM